MKSGPVKPGWQNAIEFIQQFPTRSYDFSGDAIIIGKKEELSELQHDELTKHIQEFIPWRKGPVELFGHKIEASWKSHFKWNRVLQYVDPLEDAVVADVGANNGYYMFKMLHHGAAQVVGMDPVVQVEQTYQFLVSPLKNLELPLQYELAGFDHLENYSSHFDIIFLMGILYHHTDPISILKLCKKALKPGGQLVVETMGIAGTRLVSKEFREFSHRVRLTEDRKADLAGEPDSVCLFPSGKYAGANGIWFLPSPSALVHFARRSGFKEARLHDVHRYDDEQQKTPFSFMPSLVDYLDPENRERTIEGYPSPVRIHLTARK